MYNVPVGMKRGFHAHTKVYELCVCVAGSMTVTVEDASGTKDTHISSPKGVHRAGVGRGARVGWRGGGWGGEGHKPALAVKL